MGRKSILVFLLTFVFLVFGLLLAGKAYACDPFLIPNGGDCNWEYPGCIQESAYCDQYGDCHFTWSCDCPSWGEWSQCVDGYQVRYCNPYPVFYQISQCTPESTPPPDGDGGEVCGAGGFCSSSPCTYSWIGWCVENVSYCCVPDPNLPPPPPGEVCGDAQCTISESCETCPADCGACCYSQPASNLTQKRLYGDTWEFTWDKGYLNGKQRLYLGDIDAIVNDKCSGGVGEGTGCLAKITGMDNTTESTTAAGLKEGTVYFWKVLGNSCNPDSGLVSFLTSCNFNPPSLQMNPGEIRTLTTMAIDNSSGCSDVGGTCRNNCAAGETAAESKSQCGTAKTCCVPASCAAAADSTGTCKPNCTGSQINLGGKDCVGAKICCIPPASNIINHVSYYSSYVGDTNPSDCHDVGGTCENNCDVGETEESTTWQCNTIAKTCCIPPVCNGVEDAFCRTSCHADENDIGVKNNCKNEKTCCIRTDGTYFPSSPLVSVTTPDRTRPSYSTVVTALVEGSGKVTSIVQKGGGEGQPICTAYADVVVTAAGSEAWWQAVEGDIHADGGNVSSSIPSTATFTLPYLITGTQVAGLASYTGSLIIGSGTAINQYLSSNWQAQTSYHGLRTGYGYFERILEDDPQGFMEWDGGEPGQSSVSDTSGSPDPKTELNVRSPRVLQL